MGCCSYLNSIFVNETSNVLLLCHIGYKHEYEQMRDRIYTCDWFPKKSKSKYLIIDLENTLKSSDILKLDIYFYKI